MFFQKNVSVMTDEQVRNEFKRLWNAELTKRVDARDFSKAYNYALRKYSIKDWALKNYFDFTSESSIRFKEACDAFDEGDIFWTFMLIREFASVPDFSVMAKQLTNKRRAFLSDKRKESVINKRSTRWYMHDVMKQATSGEEFIKAALEDFALYEQYKAEQKYKSAYRIIALTDKMDDYTANIKKFLYYAAKRPITPENEKQTLAFFEYAGKYYNFKRKLRNGKGTITIKDIDVLMATIAFYHNGGTVDEERLHADLHRTVKVYCHESMLPPIFTLANYLYQIDEIDMEKAVLDVLIKHGEAINEKYKKRYTFLQLMQENSSNFIFRHDARTPLECIPYNNKHDDLRTLITDSIRDKAPNTWCIVIKNIVKTFELNYKFYYEDRLLATLESIFDTEFGDFVLEYAMNTYFSGDMQCRGQRSMLVITSGKNKFTDFPKIGVMIKMEPITKKLVNIHYCILYLPEEEYPQEVLDADVEYINSILAGSAGTRFNTFIDTIESHIWRAVRTLLER